VSFQQGSFAPPARAAKNPGNINNTAPKIVNITILTDSNPKVSLRKYVTGIPPSWPPPKPGAPPACPCDGQTKKAPLPEGKQGRSLGGVNAGGRAAPYAQRLTGKGFLWCVCSKNRSYPVVYMRHSLHDAGANASAMLHRRLHRIKVSAAGECSAVPSDKEDEVFVEGVDSYVHDRNKNQSLTQDHGTAGHSPADPPIDSARPSLYPYPLRCLVSHSIRQPPAARPR
jgi:hypothetical protein